MILLILKTFNNIIIKKYSGECVLRVLLVQRFPNVGMFLNIHITYV